MDRYDPENKIALIVDEWGNWFEVEPGTNPGFLYQQNSMRDAISAMLILHIFHKHAKRIKMANIAQMVNVLQAMILTEGDKMVLTPTYHIFRMMKGHMDGESVDIDYDCGTAGVDGIEVPKISMSASKKDGILTISMCNTSLSEDEEIEMCLSGDSYTDTNAELLTSQHMTDCNTFDAPETVKPTNLNISFENSTLKLTLPKMSAAVITLKNE